MRGLKFVVLCFLAFVLRRTPRGVRGLKSTWEAALEAGEESHPSRGAWIEIPGPSDALGYPGRTPRGVRGLKSPLELPQDKQTKVAPLAGCVD